MHQVIEPLRSLESVLSWRPSPESELTRSTVELSPTYKREAKAAKTLVCHDMKGGYIEDRFVEGCSDIGYRFYHWQYLDVFVYFSHHFVTIPPPVWTNAAHKHGVKMLGTLITEWDDGKAACFEFLKSSRDFRGLANKMVDIMKYYRFDGWLVNIENVIQDNQVNNLRDFVAYLTERCHTEVKGSRVIWYDSVIKTGELKWQDQLNDENRMFFDVCDGIFLNYCWNETKLADSYKQADGDGRVHDVFVGVDVFGRGCPGGGGYNTCEALSKIHDADLSAAIFAPGWVYETQGEEEFTANQDRFWRLLHKYFSTSVLTHPALTTAFCQGYGQKYFCKGEVVSDASWYNLSLQAIQPSYNIQGQRSDFQRLEFTEDDGYLGGGCLKLEGDFTADRRSLDFCLFQMDAPVSTALYVAYTVKYPPTQSLASCLKVTLSRSQQSRVVYLGKEELEKEEQEKQETEEKEENETVSVKKAKMDKEELFVGELVKKSGLCTLQNINRWKTRCFHIEGNLLSGWNLQSVSIEITAQCTEDEVASVFLGQIQILPESPASPTAVHNLSCSKLQTEKANIPQNVSSKDGPVEGANSSQDLTQSADNSSQTYLLKWEDRQCKNVQYYNVYHKLPDHVPTLVRQCVMQSCTICLDKKRTGSFRVQTVSMQGCVLPLEDCPSCSIQE